MTVPVSTYAEFWARSERNHREIFSMMVSIDWCHKSPDSHNPYNDLISCTSSCGSSSNPGISLVMKMSRDRGTADHRYACATLKVHISNPWATAKDSSNQIDCGWRVALCWTIKCFSLSRCPPMTKRALYFASLFCVDLFAKTKLPGSI